MVGYTQFGCNSGFGSRNTGDYIHGLLVLCGPSYVPEDTAHVRVISLNSAEAETRVKKI